MLNKHTPILKYKVNSNIVYVKREDLFASPPAPALAKMRGAYILLKKLKTQGITKIGVYDTRISHAGWGVSAICKELELDCYSYFPLLKNQPYLERQQLFSEYLGATLVPLKQPSRTKINYARAKRHAYENHIHLLPLGLTCLETVLEVRKEAETIPDEFKTLVISTGSATILSGVRTGLGKSVNSFIGVSCGMKASLQKKRMVELWNKLSWPAEELLKKITIHISPKDYYTPECYPSPFPCNPYYDLKAWKWLMRNYRFIEKPVLFWNIGG